MRRTEKLLVIGLDLVILLLFLVSSTDLILKDFYFRPQKISIVIDDAEEDNWIYYKKGMDLAASLLRIDVQFITLKKDETEEDQMTYINEEVKKGAKAIIAAPINVRKMERLLEKQGKDNVPMMVLERPVEAENVFACFKGDDKKMGQDLGNAIKEDIGEEKQRVLIIIQKKEVLKIEEYYISLTSCLKEMGLEYNLFVWDNREDLSEIYQREEKVLVGLEEYSLQEIAQIYDKEKPSKYRIYGNGCNNKILSHLEAGDIQAITVVNNYDLGFLSVLLTLNKLNGGEVYETVTIQHYLVRKDTMYDEKFEKMLFPIS